MSQQERTMPPPEAAEVRRLIAKGNAKSALDAAKQLHKRLNTTATEALLVEAYVARARSLMEHDMPQEAEALVALVRERYPASAALADGVLQPTAKQALEDLVSPLADPALAAEKRKAIEQELRATLADPAALAACKSLPPDHPLRAAAFRVAQALETVTSREVEEAALELTEISHRSPLAPWKPLLRAIACFYRRDDAGCERNLAAIPADCAPARVAPVLRSLIRGGSGAGLKPAAARLAAQVGGSLERLHGMLRDLDLAFEEDDRRRILRAIGDTISVAGQDCPDIVPALREQIAVRAWLLDLSPNKVSAAMGGSPRHDAHYLLMAARAMDAQEDSELEACLTWKEFLEAAFKEDWFPERGPETATVLLHMAELAARASAEVSGWLQQGARAAFQTFTGEDMPETAFPEVDPGWLYEQACAMDPHAEAFASWLAWAESSKKGRPADVAGSWRQALPADPRPLLWLMRDAENRNVFKKALGYLREAEALDGLNPEVRRARLRLLLRGAIQRLQRGKPGLALRDLEALEALPYAAEGDRPAVFTGLRFVAALASGDPAAAAARASEMESALGRIATTFALNGLLSLCKWPTRMEKRTLSGAEGSWVEAAARVVAMVRDLGLSFDLPGDWEPEFRKELRSGTKAGPAALETFGQAALERGWRELAFAASVAGMAAGAPYEASFLVLRAGSLPPWATYRADDCLAAAIELARRQGNTALARRAVELRGTWGGGATLTESGVNSVLAQERRSRKYPRRRGEDEMFRPPVPAYKRRKTKKTQARQEELF